MPAELAVVAAFGSSVLTGLASLGVVWFQQRLQGRQADRDALISAVTEMLARSLALSMRADTLGQTMKLRSGLGEGVDVDGHSQACRSTRSAQLPSKRTLGRWAMPGRQSALAATRS
jgi:hypothetical protein